MTDKNDSAGVYVRKENPGLSAAVHMRPTTKIALSGLDVNGTIVHTLSLDGDGYGDVTVFFVSLDQVETMRDYLSAYLDGAQ